MKMITALLKASFLVVLSMLMFSTTALAQSKAAQQNPVEAKAQTYEQAKADLVVWQKALDNLPTQGAHFTPEQYQLAENWIKENMAVTEKQVAALKPKSSTE